MRRINYATVTKRFRFEAAHRLPHYDGACRKLHGHSYKLEVTCFGEIKELDGAPKEGMVVDFSVLSQAVKARVISVLDHEDVNDIFEVPTAERMAHWIMRELQSIPELAPLLVGVRLYETEDSWVDVNACDCEVEPLDEPECI